MRRGCWAALFQKLLSLRVAWGFRARLTGSIADHLEITMIAHVAMHKSDTVAPLGIDEALRAISRK